MGMTPVHVNIASDESEGTSVHLVLPPAGAFPSSSKEVRIIHAWTPGAGKHKITSTVLHKTQGIVQQGHDCGGLIPDLAPPYPYPGCMNGNLPRMLMMSSRKVPFGASTVRAEGSAIGGAHTTPNLPMLSCGEPVPIPYTYPITNTVNTVLVGLSARDITRGWEDITDAMIIEGICLALSPTKGLGLDDLIGGAAGIDPNKTAISAGIGLIRSIDRSGESGWTEPISLKVESGGGVEGAGVEIKWTPATGEAEVAAEKNTGPHKQSAGAKRDKDGNWKGTGAVPPDLFE
jgi:hypothetical protein